MPISKPQQLQKKKDRRLPNWVWQLETLAAGVALCLAALRATILETPLIEPFGDMARWDNQSISLMLSAIIFLAGAAVLIARAAFGAPCWRHPRLAAAGGILIAALFLPAAWASDRRAALTDATVLTGGILSAMLLAETARSARCARQALWLMAAVGVVASYGCLDKFLDGNQMLIDHYEKDPQAVLNALGIEPNSLERWQYEHRLYSKGSAGFFTTSNSAGSFLLLALAVCVGFLLESLGAPRGQDTLSAAFIWLAAIGCLLAGLFTTYSKGAFGSFLIYFILLAAGLARGDFLWRHRAVVLTIVVVGGAILVAAAVCYGLHYGRLPGGNSMWVRWQYWVASAQMAKDNLFGVGGGNFASAYFTYKDPAAPETINDPHCWFFSMLCRFGLFGLAAWLWWLAVWFFKPLKALFDKPSAPSIPQDPIGAQSRFWTLIFVGMLAALLAVRPFLLDGIFASNEPTEKVAAYIILVALPAAITLGGLALLKFADTPRIWDGRRPYGLVLSIFCGLIAALIHSLIDFAIFEPGIWSAFHILLAAMLILSANPVLEDKQTIFLNSFGWKTAGIAICFVLFLVIGILPPIAASHLLYTAAVKNPNRFDKQIEYALAIDPLWPRPPHIAASFLMQQAEKTKNQILLQQAETFAAIAKSRDRKNPQRDELLGDIYSRLADMDVVKRREWLERALLAYQAALMRYPGSDRLCWRAGQIAEELGQIELAQAYYQKAYDFELAYRRQFSQMYPDKKEPVSRLGAAVLEEIAERLERFKQK